MPTFDSVRVGQFYKIEDISGRMLSVRVDRVGCGSATLEMIEEWHDYAKGYKYLVSNFTPENPPINIHNL